MPPPAHGLSRRHFCAALCAAGRQARGVRGSTEAPPVPVCSRIDMDWHDSARQRPVPVRLYWPAGPSQAAVPLVVFSHGIGGSREGYSYLGAHWADHGHASLHVQHVGSDRSLWAGSLVSVVDRLQAAATVREASERVKDLGFALDCLLDPGSECAARIDRRRIAVAGHSYGANTSLLAIGARALHQGQVLDFHDPRFTSAVLISAPPFYGQADAATVLEHVAVPTLHVTATDDVIRIPGFYSASSDRLAVYDAVADPRKTLVVYAGGSHSMFTDRSTSGGVTLNPRIKQATRELTLAFLEGAFEDDTLALERWQGQWAPILHRVQKGRHELPFQRDAATAAASS
jgi:predicted dienelactone hydrolase